MDKKQYGFLARIFLYVATLELLTIISLIYLKVNRPLTLIIILLIIIAYYTIILLMIIEYYTIIHFNYTLSKEEDEWTKE